MKLDQADLHAASMCLLVGLYVMAAEGSVVEGSAIAAALFAVWKVGRTFNG